jgi:hypothetical protein
MVLMEAVARELAVAVVVQVEVAEHQDLAVRAVVVVVAELVEAMARGVVAALVVVAAQAEVAVLLLYLH